MAATGGTTIPSSRGKARLPPQRGQIKVKIISKLFEMVVRAASKAGRGICRKKKVTEEVVMAQKEHC
jgi:hypothetical protein